MSGSLNDRRRSARMTNPEQQSLGHVPGDLDGDGKVSAAEAADAARLAQEELQEAIAKAEAAARAAAEAAAAEAAGGAEPVEVAGAAEVDAATAEAPVRETEADDGSAAAPRAAGHGAGDAEPASGPLTEDQVQAVRNGYPRTGGGPTLLELGALVNGEARADVPISIPLGMLNRHGLVAGAT